MYILSPLGGRNHQANLEVLLLWQDLNTCQRRPVPVRPVPDRPTQVRPAPARPAPVRLAPVRPVPVRPVPVRLIPAQKSHIALRRVVFECLPKLLISSVCKPC